MGMITNADLEEGLSFGPLPTALMIADPAYLIAHTTTDHLAELPTIHTNPKKLAEPMRLIEWVSNVRCARFPEEQNVELIRSSKFGQSFYRITRNVSASEELLVWFRRQDLEPLLLEILKNPYVRASWLCYKRGNFGDHGLNESEQNTFDEGISERFSCSRCGVHFTYIYPFVAHYLFKCSILFPTPYHGAELNFNTPLNVSGIPNEENENDLKNHIPIPFKPTPSIVKTNVLTTPLILGITTEETNTESSVRHRHPDAHYASSVSLHSQNKPHLENHVVEEKCKINFTKQIHKSLNFPTPSDLDLSNKRPYQSYNSISSIITALQKKYALKPNSYKSVNTCYPKAVKSVNIVGLECTHPNIRKPRSKSGLLSLKTRNPLVEQLLQTLVKKTENATVVDSTTSSAISPGLISLVLAQNWCARCSITFRLTSDLVHHMRTHHNQSTGNHIRSSKSKNDDSPGGGNDDDDEEVDSSSVNYENENHLLSKKVINVTNDLVQSKQPNKSRKLSPSSNNRLNCDLCGEVFRERHHLTRHMLSHS